MLSSLPRSAWYLLLLLLVPIVPFVIWGDRLEPWIETTIHELNGWLLIGFSLAAMVVDILLPVPSSMIGTMLGTRFPWLATVALIWIGLTLGASLGFGLARWFGAALVLRLSNAEELQRLQDIAAKHGPRALVLTRGLPVLAEATVLMFGAAKLSWRRFFPAVALANLGLALAYATLGWLGHSQGVALWAIYISILIPATSSFIARWFWPARTKQHLDHSHQEADAPRV
jgi:uncharacterized membrane protein YdjX (TVP38/TMEM64 family)